MSARGRAWLLAASAAVSLAAAAAGAAERAAARPSPFWSEILAARVNDAGEVAYRSLRAHDGERLERYLGFLADVDPRRLGRDPAIAFWVNAYNALVVFAVIHGANPETLAGRARLRHWFQREIGGARRTPDDIEQVLARYASADPRIYFAISNGTRGGPPLAVRPYSGKRLDAMLAAATRRFVNDRRWNRFDVPGRRAELSALFRWHQVDFERAGGTVLGFISAYVSGRKKALIVRRPEIVLHYADYDWSLNAAPGERPF